MTAGELHKDQSRAEFRSRDLFYLALSMGALTGALEGMGFYGAQAGRWVGQGLFGSTVEPCILYVSPLFTLFVFAGVALLLQLFFLAFGTAPATRVRVTFGVLSFLAFFDWLWLTEYFALYSAVILALGLASAAGRWFQWHWRRVLELAPKMSAASAAYICVAALGISFLTWRQENAARAALPPPPAGAPNIVWIILDTTRADHLSVYGYGRKTTPYLESLAAEGTTFDNAVSASSWTLPSHVSMLTGRYPREHGATLNGYDGRYASVAAAFDQLGYVTGGFSGNMDWFATARGMTRGFQHFEDGFWSLSSKFAETGYGRIIGTSLAWATNNRLVLGYKRARDVNRTALRWLDTLPKRPFLLVLNYYDANSGGAVPETAYRNLFSSWPLPPPAGSAAEFTPAEIDKSRSNEYDGALLYMDTCVHEIVEALGKRGLADNLVVVVAADHGELLGEHGMSGHRNSLYWDLIHVPLIFRGSSGIARGLRIAQPVSLVSLPATLLELAGQAEAAGFPAPSLAKFWKPGGKVQAWPFPISELAQMAYPGLENTVNYSGSLSAIATPRWLLIDHSAHGPSLYAWPGDPENLHDLAATPGGHALSEALTGCLQARNVGLRGANCRMEASQEPVMQGSLKPFGATGEH
jgi:arylsulfatase A-like enzyme